MEWIIFLVLTTIIFFVFTNRKKTGNFILASIFGVFGVILFFLKKERKNKGDYFKR